MKQALIVGIDNYPSAPLKGCVNDATALANILSLNENGSKNFDIRLESNVHSKGQLRKKIRQLFKSDADMVLFYFSGHGYLDDVGGYILTPDSKQDDYGIPMDEILQMANNSDVRNKILIFDCCNSGILGSRADYNGAILLSKGVTILTSSREQEASLIRGEHSVFTYLLIAALRGGAADLKGDITTGSIYAFIDQAIGSWGQRPLFKANISRFTVIRSVEPQIKFDVLRKILKYFNSEDTVYAANPICEHSNTDIAIQENVLILEEIKVLEKGGLLIPHESDYLFEAAHQQSKGYKLTNMGKYYWMMIKSGYL
jgi:Caspase domain